MVGVGAVVAARRQSESAVSVDRHARRCVVVLLFATHRLRCCAIDRHARQQDLVNGRAVTIYFGLGRASIGGSAGAVYLFDDAAIVPTGEELPCIQKVAQGDL